MQKNETGKMTMTNGYLIHPWTRYDKKRYHKKGPLLDFQWRPVGARRNWRNVLNKQRFEATLQQHLDATKNDDLGTEVTKALQRAIERQIASDDTLTPNSTVHITIQSNNFTHAFQSTTFTVHEFEDGSERLET